MSLLFLILTLLLNTNGLVQRAAGLKLPLIHPESPENPTSHGTRTLFKGPQVHIQSPYYYMIKINLGTFKPRPPNPPHKTYYLYMDTGSDLLWLQCEGCQSTGGRCFPQKDPVYQSSASTTYHTFPCNKHPLCTPNQCIKGSCSYNIRYADNTSSSGLLATEIFSFGSDPTRTQLVFGCGLNNKNNYGNSNNQIAGIMGLGWGPSSIITQENSITRGAFSYCLPLINKYTRKWPTTYLRFGSDIIKKPNLKSTPLIQIKNDIPYHLILRGLSLNNKKLNISVSNHPCIIDSGTPFSRLIRPAYLVLVKALRNHFSHRFDVKPYKGPKVFELCYEWRWGGGFKSLPRMSLHLERADLVLQPEALFLVMDKIGGKGEYFCLALIPSDVKTVIGSYQQTNQRLVYDTKQKLMLFGVEDCSKDA